MESNTSKIILIVIVIVIGLAGIVTAIVVGGGAYIWQTSKHTEVQRTTQSTTQAGMTTYSSEKYSLECPAGYKVDGSDYTLSLTREGNRKLVIFQAKDGHYGEGGIQLGAPQEQIDQDVPKEQLTVGSGDNKYDVWIYYNMGDAAAENELAAIFDSIVVK